MGWRQARAARDRAAAERERQEEQEEAENEKDGSMMDSASQAESSVKKG